MNLKGILPYLILPLGISIYEVATLVVMSTHSLDSITLSVYQPQNAFISMFWYDGNNNLIGFLFLFVFSDFTLLYLPLEQKYIRAFSILILSFLIGYYANVEWLNTVNFNYSFGQSGVVFALFGITVGIIVFDSVVLLIHRNYLLSFSFIFTSLVFLIVIFTDFDGFFNISPGITYIVHEYAFEYGLIAGSLLSIFQEFIAVITRRSYGYQYFIGGI